MRRSGACGVWLAFALLLLPGCNDAERATRQHPPTPADVVPRDATAYAEATIRLVGPRARAAKRFVASLTGATDVPEDAVLDLLADFGGVDFDFDRLDAWLGARGAIFVADLPDEEVPAAIVLDSTNARAAERFIRGNVGPGARAVRYRGVRFWLSPDGKVGGLVDGHVVLSWNVAVMRAAIGAQAAPFSRTHAYRHAGGAGNAFAFIYLTPDGLRSGFGGLTGWTRSEVRLLQRAVAPGHDVVLQASVQERQVQARIEGLRRSRGRPAEGIEALPDDSWLAISSSDLSSVFLNSIGTGLGSTASPAGTLARLLGVPVPDPLLKVLGRGSVYFQGDPEDATGQLLAKVKDRRATNREIARFGRAIARGRTHRVEWVSRDPANPEFEAHPRAGGRSDLYIEMIGRDLTFEFGAPGGAGLEREPVYRQAKRALGTAPTVLFDVQKMFGFGDPAMLRRLGPIGRVAFVAAAERGRGDAANTSVAIRLRPGKPPPPRPGESGDAS